MYVSHRCTLSVELVAQLVALKYLRKVNRERFYAPAAK